MEYQIEGAPLPVVICQLEAGETMLTIIGNLARDPELRTLGNGSTVANLTIASSTRQFNRQSNQWEDGDTLFMNCSAWDSQRQKFASNIVATLAKGMRVIASGRLQQRSYQAQDGSTRVSMELNADGVEFCGSARREDAPEQDELEY